jgi:hypothetical protein
MTPLDWGAPDHPAPFSLLCVIDFGPDTEGDRYGFLRLDTAQQLQALAKYPVAFIFNIQFIKTSIDAAAGGSRGES